MKDNNTPRASYCEENVAEFPMAAVGAVAVPIELIEQAQHHAEELQRILMVATPEGFELTGLDISPCDGEPDTQWSLSARAKDEGEGDDLVYADLRLEAANCWRLERHGDMTARWLAAAKAKVREMRNDN